MSNAKHKPAGMKGRRMSREAVFRLEKYRRHFFATSFH